MKSILLPLLLISTLSVFAKENDECAQELISSPAMLMGSVLLQDGVTNAVVGRNFVEFSGTVPSQISINSGHQIVNISRRAKVQISKDASGKSLTFKVTTTATVQRPRFFGHIFMGEMERDIEREADFVYLSKDAAKYPTKLGGITRVDKPQLIKQRDGSFAAQMELTYQQSPNEELEDAIFYVAIVVNKMWLKLPAQ